MQRLSLDTLATLPPAIRQPAYDSRATTIGIVHLGPGAFFRAHVASYVDSLLAREAGWGLCAVALRTPGLRDSLAPQDGLYTLALLGETPSYRIIGALRELLVAPETPERVAARLADPATRLVTLTVTEKGYCLGPDGALDFGHPDVQADLGGRPTSAIGWIVQGLAARRAAGVPPFVVMSCDNLGHNGAKLRGAVLALAGRRDSALAGWVEATTAFPATMVDSITPATDDALRARVRGALGVDDAWPVQREAFAQWVVEDVPGLPDLASVGATVARDVAGYELAKLRLLNGAHSALAYLGLLRGHATVAEAMADRPLRDFIERMMRDDIAPTLSPPAGLDISAYIGSILDRFDNPAIAHALAQIAWDGTQKLPYRLIDTIADLQAMRRPVAGAIVAVAGWMRFIERQAAAGAQIVDPLAGRLAEIGGDPSRFFELPMFERLRPLRADILAACASLGEAGDLPGA